LLRNGRGLCESRCENLEGSYKCSCFAGTNISSDGHSCEENDLCRSGNNGGCQHNCLSVGGVRTICSCDKGYKLDDDEKSCQDIDECLDKSTFELNHRCNYECLNTIGSYKCIDASADQQENDQDILKFDQESFNISEEMYRITATTNSSKEGICLKKYLNEF
jgi:Coagulation Factor Xa inhibitory site/Calcium-binding EGF domain